MLHATISAKVQNNTQTHIRCTQIITHLCLVYILQFRHGLQLNDNTIIANKVCIKVMLQLNTIIIHLKPFLTLIRNSHPLKLNLKRILIHIFRKSRL